MSEFRWYVVRTKPRQEQLAEDNLSRQHYRVWLPRITCERRLRGRWRDSLEPLFPGYLFVQLRPGVENYSPIRSTRGVADLVRFANEPAVIPLGNIEALQQLQQSNVPRSANQPFEAGEKLRIVDGPFSGWEGVYELSEGGERVTVLLDMLGKGQRLSIRKDDVSTL
jgi:transcriptional antiterminator RfaH